MKQGPDVVYQGAEKHLPGLTEEVFTQHQVETIHSTKVQRPVQSKKSQPGSA